MSRRIERMRKLFCFLFFLLIPLLHAARIVVLGHSGDSALFHQAFRDLALPKNLSFEYHCTGTESSRIILESARRADLLILNARSRELRTLAEQEIDHSGKKLYALNSRLLGKRIPALEPPEIRAYMQKRTPKNFRNMVLRIIHTELDPSVKFDPPDRQPNIGVTHPDAGKIFRSIAEYRKWAEANGRFSPEGGWVAFAVHSASIVKPELKLFRHLTDECERQGLNVAIVYGDEVEVIRDLLLDPHGRPQVDAVLALSFKFKAGLGEKLRCALKDLDVPVFNALRLYRQTTPEWESSRRGMNDFSVAFGFIAPEISGLIEPSLLFGSRDEKRADGKRIRISEPFPEQIRFTVRRLKKWIRLRRAPNRDKKIAIFLYNGSGGKQNIGASGLNVPRSLVNIIRNLAANGFPVGGLEKADEDALVKEILKSARNAGSWAPGEVDRIAQSENAVRLSLKTYTQWFSELPGSVRNRVIAQWGNPERSKIMFSNGSFILPMLKRGNLVILPEPMRGWLDDPHKLLHSAELPPPHQYLAVYFWLAREFKADAMIHLGRHGSSEWLPGKQLGLKSTDFPMIVRGDIPEIYPYISDGIGEGIVAKRRAQALMIAHLTPLLKIPETEGFLPELKQRISDCQTADPGVRTARRSALRKFAAGCGLKNRLDLDSPGWFHRIEEYAEHRSAPAPFGLHSFGTSPGKQEIGSMLALIPESKRRRTSVHLENSGADEIKSLLHALNGGFIEPGPSGDPVRNPDILPSGRNFYSFDPAKIPSAEAMKTGTKLASEFLVRQRVKNGRLPRSAAILLWAGESIRTDGVNEAIALALMGMEPVHDPSGRITGIKPVPGAMLGRPRIDVMLTASGAYRDQFGDLLRLLNRARRQAARLKDAENFIRSETPGIFFPAPGTYGTRVAKLSGGSGIWEDTGEIALLYLRNMAFTLDNSGSIINSRNALENAAKNIEAILHSRSSSVYGVTDIDEMYQYMGGLSLAVGRLSGKTPSAWIADQRKRSGEHLTELKSFIAAELDSRLFSPEWIRSMMREHYAGAKTLARITDNLWGWQTVAPEMIHPDDWNKLHEIYVQDKFELGLNKFFGRHSEWAYQSMTGRMLEAIRKNYWTPDLKTKQSIASEYARSVIRQGMACCDHTCNNPLLNQMVISLISMPGILSPEMTMKFRIAVEQAGGKTIGEQVKNRMELRKTLRDSFGKKQLRTPEEKQENASARIESTPKTSQSKPVKGYRIKERNNEKKSELSSSGLKWTILAAVFLAIALFGAACMRKES